MDAQTLQNKLSDLPLGEIRYFESVESTNDEALAWAAGGAEDLSLVIADEQIAGRGRLGRKWFTPRGAALAFSLVLRAPAPALLSRIVGLAALSITDSLLSNHLAALIKWPNDVLVNGRKLAGILIETVWSGTEVDTLVVGMGINMGRESVPPPEDLQFPATSLEEELGRRLDREQFLHDVLAAFIARRPGLDTDEFLEAWDGLLAFRGDQVSVRANAGNSYIGELLGLDASGGLRLRDQRGNILTAQVGDVSLRPLA